MGEQTCGCTLLHAGRILTSLLVAMATMLIPADLHGEVLPPGFVHVQDCIPDIALDLRYATGRNFVGKQIDGYLAPRLILTRDACSALDIVQEELRKTGFGLMVFDGYRPQRAVDQFVRWSQEPDDPQIKAEYYPDIARQELIGQGYIASKSSHSRGSTVDLTIVGFRDGKPDRPLDMGSPFDYFGPCSWSDYRRLSRGQLHNRSLLKSVMETHGFEPYPQEWWHFTLKNEPFPDRYFDFPVE